MVIRRVVRGAAAGTAVAALVLLAAWPLTRVYHGELLGRLLAGAAVAAVVLSLLVRRLPGWTAAPLSVLALAGYTLLAVKLSAASGGVPGGLLPLWRDALRNGIPRLLTALIPVEPQPDTVLVPVVATWVAGLAAAEVTLRHRRALAGLAPPTALYAAALVVVGPNARPVVWSALAFSGVAGLVLLLAGRAAPDATGSAPAGGEATAGGGDTTTPDRDVTASAGGTVRQDPLAAELARLPRGQRWWLRARMVTGAAVTLVVVAAIAAAVGPAIAARVGDAPADPRRYVAPPRLHVTDDNPLSRLSGWALTPKVKLFDTDITTPADVDEVRVRLAVMPDYDGVTWRVDGDYRAAGRVLPPVTGPGAPAPGGDELSARITIDGLDGMLLPEVGTVHEVDGVRVGYDQQTGTLIRPEGLAKGVTYTLRSRRSPVDVNLLPDATVPSGPAVARFLHLEVGAPEEMLRLADQLGSDEAAPYQRALALEQFLSEHYTLALDAPSGHAYPNLAFFLFGPSNAGGKRGTSEQFAASFAVLGRMMGLPTRVVVGFRARTGRSTVTGADALAWPEVLFSGVGWVPFDPLPRPDTPPRPVSDDFRPSPAASTPPPSVAPAVSVSPIAATRSPSAAPAAPTGARIPVRPLAAVGAGLLGMLLAGLGAVVVARRVRRRRRVSRGSPGERVAGAWLEVLDALRLAGAPAGADLAVSEVVRHAAELADRGGRSRLPAPPLDDLAALANQVTFGDWNADEAAARRAATQALAFTAELRARRSWWRRLRWSVDPRPLRWHRR